MKTDLRLPCARAWMDGTGRDGSVGGSHGLWLWKLVSDLKKWIHQSSLLAEQTGMTAVFGFFEKKKCIIYMLFKYANYVNIILVTLLNLMCFLQAGCCISDAH